MQDNVLRLIEEAKEMDEGSMSPGQTLDWDSIAVITFMASAQDQLGKTVSASQLNKCVTVDDVIELLSKTD